MATVRLFALITALSFLSGSAGCRLAITPLAARAATEVRRAEPERPLASLLPVGFRRGDVSLLVEKHAYRLTAQYRGATVKTYPVVFGPDPVHDKLREGDGCTPEGLFHIAMAHARPDWTYSMLLDYPTADSRRKHDAAVRRRQIPRGSAIGSAIAIHGVPRGHDDYIDNRINWTAGCVSLRTADIADLYRAVRVGTPVRIVH